MAEGWCRWPDLWPDPRRYRPECFDRALRAVPEVLAAVVAAEAAAAAAAVALIVAVWVVVAAAAVVDGAFDLQRWC